MNANLEWNISLDETSADNAPGNLSASGKSIIYSTSYIGMNEWIDGTGNGNYFIIIK